MLIKSNIFVIIILLFPLFCDAQKRGAVWCFGDSALVNFSDTSNIITGQSRVKSRGSCASISDSSGNLIFYSSYDPSAMIAGTDPVKIFDANNSLIFNGDSIKGGGWYKELVIIPNPLNDSTYYLFNIGVTLDYGIYYNIIDMKANGGMGAVTQKNVQLQSFKQVDCLTAIKHGNGRDWWMLFRKSDFPSGSNSDYYEYLITPNGISNVIIQNVGTQNSTNSGRIVFSHDGNKFSFINLKGMMEFYNFDRCTGTISNPQLIFPEQSGNYNRYFWAGEFSPSNHLFYTTLIPLAMQDTSRLIQFDLTSANIAASADTLWETDFIRSMGHLKLADDGKIYLANSYYQVYPYPDTTYNTYNMNLSVINSPDSLGSACGLQQYSFYLGGARTYGGLPNNPDYNLGPKIGSGCDTINSVNEQSQQVVISNIFPNPNNGDFTVNYFLQNGKAGVLNIFNIEGKKIFEIKLPRYTYMQNVKLNFISKGIYALRIQSEDKSVIKKFIKQ